MINDLIAEQLPPSSVSPSQVSLPPEPSQKEPEVPQPEEGVTFGEITELLSKGALQEADEAFGRFIATFLRMIRLDHSYRTISFVRRV